MPSPISSEHLRQEIQRVVDTTPALDIHTHLYPPSFGSLALNGIDELVTYHYLIAELFRSSTLRPEEFWAMSKPEQADAVWEALFVRNTPISEAARGVVNILTAFGLDPAAPNLEQAREFFAARDAHRHLDEVLRLANVTDVVMTNDPFDPAEAARWSQGGLDDSRFHAVLRLDLVVNHWDAAREKLLALGYNVAEIPEHSTREIRRFLDDWIKIMRPLYMAVSLGPDFAYPEDSSRAHILANAVLPTCQAHDMPFAMMIGVRRRVNPALREGGDGVGRANIAAVERICAEFPETRFLVTVLSRENQHELCVAARKFGNLMPFGCWWFVNNPSIVLEITRERLEMLGASFIPQHSDARILEQLIYKWAHARRAIEMALFETYEALVRDGWRLTTGQIQRDVERMFQGNFRNWTGLSAGAPAMTPAGVDG
jgi:hypothetical protein